MKSLEQLFFQRPRILNQLHRLRLAHATSQTTTEERAALERYATGARKALEIGTYQGVSAVRIARALAPDGILFCVDPWLGKNGRTDPCWQICERNLLRANVRHKVRILRAFTSEIESELPTNLDFSFIDGDHSMKGIETDWRIVSPRMRQQGVICLHDSVTPVAEPWRHLDSVDYYQDVISKDWNFETIQIVHSMAVVRRR